MKEQELPKPQGTFSRIKQYLSYPGRVFNAFLNRNPKLKKAYEIITHTTVIRITALATAIACSYSNKWGYYSFCPYTNIYCAWGNVSNIYQI